MQKSFHWQKRNILVLKTRIELLQEQKDANFFLVVMVNGYLPQSIFWNGMELLLQLVAKPCTLHYLKVGENIETYIFMAQATLSKLLYCRN